MVISGVHNLQILRGLADNRTLLSCTADGTKVDLFPEDDASGRQRWTFEQVEGNTYNIIASGGLTSDRKFLSCTADGTKVDLFPIDDHSGRQAWIVTADVPNSRTVHIQASGGLTSDRKFLVSVLEVLELDELFVILRVVA